MDERSDVPSSHVERLGAGAGVAIAGFSAGRLLQVVVEAVVARGLGPAAFGAWALGGAMLRVLGTVGVLGLDNGVLFFGSTSRRRASPRAVRRVVQRTVVLALLAGGMLAVGLVAIAGLLARAFSSPPLASGLPILALALPLVCASRVASVATRLSGKMHWSVLSREVGQPAVTLAAAVPLAALGAGLDAVLGTLVAGYAASLTLAGVFLARLFGPHRDGPAGGSAAVADGAMAEDAATTAPREHVARHRRVSPGEAGTASPGSPSAAQFAATSSDLGPPPVRELLGYSWVTAVAGLVGVLLVVSDRILLGLLGPSRDVGLYQAAAFLVTPLPLVLRAFIGVLAPLAAELRDAGRRRELAAAFRLCTRWGLLVGVALFPVYPVARRELTALVFGSEFVPGQTALLILAVAQLINVGTGGVGALLMMTGHPRLWTAISVGAFVVDVALNVALIPAFGIAGAATATVLSIALWSAAGLAGVHRRLGVWAYDRQALKALASGVAGLAAAGLVGAAVPGPPSLRLAAVAAASVAGCGAAYLALGPDADDRAFLETLRRRLG